MSYILDALRKSEQERLRGQPLATLSHSPSGGTDNARPAWLLPLLIGNLMVFTILGVWWLRSVASSSETAAQSTNAVVPLTAVQASQSAATRSAPPDPRTTNEHAAARSQQTGYDPSVGPESAAPEYIPLPAAPLSERAMPERPLNNADYEAVGDWRAGDAPALAVTSHVYSSDRRARNIIINGVRLREGDQLPSGVSVLEITTTGARVSYNGAEQELEIGR